MQENTTKIIGVCVADISTDYNDRFFEAFKRLAHEFHFKVLFFSAFSPLYWDQKHDIGEGNIYQLIDTDVLDGLIMLTITINNELVRESIIEHAKKRDIPVISIEYPLEGSLSIIYEYKSTIRKLLSHLIDDHGYRRINFIAGPKDNLFSEERLQVYRDVLTEHQIPVEEARIGYGDFWYGPTHTVVQSFIDSDLPMPEAIVCANDSMAIAAIQYLTDHGYNVPEGAKQMEALNYYTNETVTIPLDPTSTPQENAQRFFAKYNKQKRTFEALTQLIRETKDEISYLESIQTSLDIAMTENDLAAIKEELSETGYVRRKTVRKKIKLKNEPLHYISSDGFHMYVGKNNLQNDALTFDFAAGCDWWFHAKQAPGSHVIVKTNGEELPDRTFEEAGKLAAYYSSMRGSEKVEIDYIEKKHIKKPKGAKPGFVVYYTNYSLVIDSDIRGIQKISGS